jgi:hypothetical protein
VNPVEFLTARLNEDEQVAVAAAPSYRRGHRTDVWEAVPAVGPPSEVRSAAQTAVVRGTWPHEAAHISRHDPARVLADVAAKRAILAEHEPRVVVDGYIQGEAKRRQACAVCVEFYDDENSGGLVTREREHRDFPCDTIRALVRPYADHPDFDSTWTVETR